MDRKELYKAATEALGADVQVNKSIEELAELLVALIHYRENKATLHEVQDEIADVTIMTEQLKSIFGEDEIATIEEKKLNKLKKMMGLI